jgi:CBS domain-containing protein
MSTHDASREMSASETEPQSLAELFHLVKSLIPENQKLYTASPDMTVAEAIQVMHRHNFSQLPVVAGNTVLGVFSFRSLTTQLLKMGQIREHFGDLPVDEFMEHFKFVQPSDNWESILSFLDSDNGVLVGYRDQLEGIVTAMDVLKYLDNIASPFVLLAEIELSLRRIIRACVSNDQLQICVQNSLASKYSLDEMPTRLSEMTLNDYVQIIGDGRNWAHFSVVFGKGEWQRKTTTERLKEIRDLRNDVFHFKRKLTSEDYETLATRREWLQMKTRAFEARKAEPSRDIQMPSPGRKGHTNRAEFLAKCSPPIASFFERVLDLAEQRGYTIYWGTKGFSARAYLPQEEQWASFSYGWPEELFEFYFGHLPLPDKEARMLRRELMRFGVFREAGQKTLRANLTREILPKMLEVYNFILDKMDDIVKRY